MTSKRHVRIYSYNPNSEGAKALAQITGIKRLRHSGSKFRGGPGKVVICWGSGKALEPLLAGTKLLNPPEVVLRTSCKARFFESLDENVRVPEWTREASVAQQWVNEGHDVCARLTTTGHSAEGLVILNKDVDFLQAPLYTKYIKKEQEYRVHCFAVRQPQNADGSFTTSYRVIDIQRKIKRPDFEGTPNWRIRNHANGFVYVRNDVHPPEDVSRQALQAFDASGLDFGAVDVIYNQKQGKAYVLEINTAPGITGRSVEIYSKAFSESLDLS